MSELDDQDVVVIKLMCGDIIVGTNEGIEELSQGMCIGNPMVMTSTAGYLLMTDFAPFLISESGDKMVVANPNSVIYVELANKALSDYYRISVKYRDAIADDMDAIIEKSHTLILKTLHQTLADKIAKHESHRDIDVKEDHPKPTTIGDLLDTPIADAFGPQADSGDEQTTDSVDSKVIDFNKILHEAINKKRDPLN